MFAWRSPLAPCFVAFIAGCIPQTGFSTVPPTDTPATNAVRVTKGIREIKAGWTFYGRQFSEESWMDPQTRIGASQCKKVVRNPNNTIHWEQDYYRSGRKFTDPEGTYDESLSIYYEYPTGQFVIAYVGDDPTVQSLMRSLQSTSLAGQAGANNQQTLNVADQILAAWRLNRL